VLPPYCVRLVTFDIIPILLIFSGKVKTRLMCGGQKLTVCVQIIPDHNSERITKTGALLRKLS